MQIRHSKTSAGAGQVKCALCAVVLVGLNLSASAQYFDPGYTEAMRYTSLRQYYGYPYRFSYGPRYDPYWSYNSSYFPELYYGDGSYYGIGYSGYNGNGWYGSYYYW